MMPLATRKSWAAGLLKDGREALFHDLEREQGRMGGGGGRKCASEGEGEGGAGDGWAQGREGPSKGRDGGGGAGKEPHGCQHEVNEKRKPQPQVLEHLPTRARGNMRGDGVRARSARRAEHAHMRSGRLRKAAACAACQIPPPAMRGSDGWGTRGATLPDPRQDCGSASLCEPAWRTRPEARGGGRAVRAAALTGTHRRL